MQSKHICFPFWESQRGGGGGGVKPVGTKSQLLQKKLFDGSPNLHTECDELTVETD